MSAQRILAPGRGPASSETSGQWAWAWAGQGQDRTGTGTGQGKGLRGGDAALEQQQQQQQQQQHLGSVPTAVGSAYRSIWLVDDLGAVLGLAAGFNPSWRCLLILPRPPAVDQRLHPYDRHP
ncbi:hypothetical protein M419DRAFT_7040 [Trichoderma reesei RUT C-30]|uniref:Uncharacterized protein n=1 Tax=Hypocrea jecorina (strain ATCC 56765 / BCRC 32924 / NRRL 11460 / Rut C-30) TaxID=1344414 RepID=A0A024SF47_HYPJR|nr:hypothetical protein M419DRAFT_7040 [Trichoderma reesei RUT C-30]